MSGPPCAGHVPSVELFIKVSYCHDHRAWEAAVNVDGHTADGATINMSAGRHTFGPFDSSIEVGHWLAGQSRVLKAMASPDMMEKLC